MILVSDPPRRVTASPERPWTRQSAGGPSVYFVSVALDETLFYGAGSPQVIRRALALLDRVASAAPDERLAPLRSRRALLTRLSAESLPDAFFRDLATVPDPFGLGGPG